MSETNNEKNYIDNLLRALSVNDAIRSFTETDNYIIELLRCSSDDFLSLNDHFKNYHKESKTISQNASSIIDILTDQKTNASFSNLKSFGKGFDQLTNVFSKHLNLLDFEIKKTTNKIENLRIAHNNYKQNLYSIRIIIAGSNNWDKISPQDLSSIQQKVENIKKQFGASENSIQDYISYATEICLFLTNLKKQNYVQVQKLSEKIDSSLLIFERKYKEAAEAYPSLKTLTEKNTANIASIITNLQYHDIIRQKIEHIQRTHKDIMNELKSYNADDQSLSMIHNKAKTFLKIRDVAGLQAAQLLHANKQYQTAIEEIGKNLESIGNDMIAISCMCDNLVGKSEQTKNTFFEDVVSLLNGALDYTAKLSTFIKEIKDKMHCLSQKEVKISAFLSEINSEKNNIVDILKKADTNKEDNSSFKQLHQLMSDTGSLENHINEIHKELSNTLIQLEALGVDVSSDSSLLNQLETLNTIIPDLIVLLTNDIRKIDEYLYLNSSISNRIADNIKHSLCNIKYYELFENSCEKIVEELNSINVKLNYGNEPGDLSRTENLKHLKDRYTMASEHIIHEQITKMNVMMDLGSSDTEKIIDLADQNTDQDDDNLELF